MVDTEEFVDELAEQLGEQGLEVQTLISCGNHVAEIVKAARSVNAGLIAMATRSRDRLESRISGSVANSVLEAATVACLVVRATERSQAHGRSVGRPRMDAVSPADNI